MRKLYVGVIVLLFGLFTVASAQQVWPSYASLKEAQPKLATTVADFLKKSAECRKLNGIYIQYSNQSKDKGSKLIEVANCVEDRDAIRSRLSPTAEELFRVHENKEMALQYGWTNKQYRELNGWWANFRRYANQIKESDKKDTFHIFIDYPAPKPS